MSSALAITVFAVGLVASIMVHEWGHFATARRFGMRADRFFLGFGPTLWSKRVGETEYGVKALPFGGFVRIAGMTDEDERLPSVPAALRQRVRDGADPTAAFAALLSERGTPQRLRSELVRRFDATLAAGHAGTTGAPAGVDLTEEELRPGRSVGDDEQRVAVGARSSGADGVGVGAHGGDDHAAATVLATDVDPAMLAVELINSEIVPTGRVGDLHHRLTRGDEGRMFQDRPPWQRVVVLASGFLLHFVQAALLIFLGWLLVGPTVLVPVVSAFATGELSDGTEVASAAEEAGLEVGDRIVAVDGLVSDDFAELRRVIQENPGVPLAVVVERDGVEEQLTFTVTPSSVRNEEGETVGQLGFLPSTESRPMPADEAMYRTVVGPGSFPDLLVGSVAAIGEVFGPEGIAGLFSQVTGDADRDVEGGVSIIGAASFAGQGTEQYGLLFLFGTLAMVNVFIGLFNALPLPPLDGGHIAVLAVEEGVNARRRVRGERPDYKVDPQTIASIALPVLALVVAVSLALVYLDVTNPLSL